MPAYAERRREGDVRVGRDALHGSEGHRGIRLVGHAASEGSAEVPLRASDGEGHESGDGGRYQGKLDVPRLKKRKAGGRAAGLKRCLRIVERRG